MQPVFIGGLQNGGVNQVASNGFQSWIVMPYSHFNNQDIKDQIRRGWFQGMDPNYVMPPSSPNSGGVV